MNGSQMSQPARTPVGWGAARPRDAAAQDGELVTEERILGHERQPAAHQIAERANSDGRGGRADGGRELVLEAADDGATKREQAVEQASWHGQLPSVMVRHPGRKGV